MSLHRLAEGGRAMHLVHRREIGQFLNDAGLLGTGVEVGVADGQFARAILRTWQGKRLVLVDCWQSQDPTVYYDIAKDRNLE